MKLSKRAVRKLLKVKEHILEEPKRLRMDNWVLTPEKIADLPEFSQMRDCMWNEPVKAEIIFPQCNTVGCIAGWTVLLTDGMKAAKDDQDVFEARACEILGLPKDFSSCDLFYVDGWPSKFAQRYMKAKTPKARANVVAARIDAFIEQYG